MRRWLSLNALWLLLPVIMSAIAGAVWTYAMFYVSAMILFLLLPTVVMFVYFNYALTPEAREVISPRQITISAKGLEIIFYDDGQQPAVTAVRHIEADLLTDLEISFGFVTFSTRERYRPVQIPLSSLPDGISVNDLYSLIAGQS